MFLRSKSRTNSKRRFKQLMFCMAFLIGQTSFAQTMSEYTFSQTSGTYTPITGETVLWSGYDGFDTNSTTVNLTTPFNYLGTDYSVIYVNSDGYIIFGNTTTSGYPITVGRNGVAAFAADLDAKAASAGTALPSIGWKEEGNEIIFQWENLARWTGSGASSAENLKFQIRLNTSNSEIKIVYGECTDRATPTTSGYPQVGLGNTTTFYSNRTIVAGDGDWINSTAGTSNSNTMAYNGSTKPSNGLTFTWSLPDCYTPGGLTATNITKNSALLQWNNPAELFDIEWGTQGFTPTNNPSIGFEAVSGNSALLQGLNSSTSYEYYLRSNCGEGQVSNWAGPFTFTTLCDYPDITEITPGTVCGLGEVTLNITTEADLISWYDDPVGGTKVGEGDTFVTPVISQTTNYYVQVGNITPGVTTQVGNGTLTSNSGGTSPFARLWGGYKTQNIIKASELIAAGVAPGEIVSLGVDVTTAPAGSINNLTIHIGHTTNDAATSTHVDYNTLQLVYSNATQNFTTGINTFTFTQSFEWDGESNIVVQYNFSNNDSGSSSQAKTIRYINPGFTCTTYTYADNRTAEQILNTMSGAVSNGTNTSGGTSTTSSRPNYYFNGNGLCASPRTEVVATVTTPPTFTLSESTTEICPEENSAVITITEGAADYDTYVWEPATGVSGDVENGWTFSPEETTTYTLTVSQSEGTLCATSVNLEVVVNPLPVAITTHASETEICQNETIELSITGNINSGTAVFGEGTTAPDSTSWPNPFSKWWGGTKHQLLFTADELAAQGLITGSEITALSFDFAAINTSANNVCTDFTIRMGNTSVTEMNSFVSGTTNVYGPQSFIPTETGIITFELTTAYIWDGVSNIVVETVHNTGNSGSGSGTRTKASSTPNNSVFYAASDTVAGGVPGFDALNTYGMSGGTTLRPNVTFTHSIEQTMITWSPATDLYLDEEATQPYEEDSYALAVYYKPSTWGMNTYTATSYTELGCSVSSSVEITVHSTETPVGETEQLLTEGQTLADLVVEGENLVWYTDEDLTDMIPNTTVPVTGIYYVTTEAGDCTSEALAINVTMMLCSELGIPTGEATQTLTEGQTLADLVVEGENLQWYADADLTEALEDTHVAEDDITYYVTQTIGLCTSEALAVTVDVTLGRTDFETFAFKFYPNPVGDVLNLTSNSEISQINLFNMLGQKVTVVASANNTQVDMSGLPTGNYIISVTIEGITKTFKVVKN
jgi:hypothetical protein